MTASEENREKPAITAMIRQLHDDDENGEISCLIAIIIRHDGDSATIVRGSANNIVALGLIEMLRTYFVNCEVESGKAERPGKLCLS